MGSFVEADDGDESSPELGTGVGTKIGWSGWDGGGPGGDGGPDGGAGTLTGLLSEAAGRSALGTGTLTGLLKEAAGIDANGAAAALGKQKTWERGKLLKWKFGWENSGQYCGDATVTGLLLLLQLVDGAAVRFAGCKSVHCWLPEMGDFGKGKKQKPKKR